MPARSAVSRKWIAGGLHAARAAALLTIATGVNGTLAAIWPHYEPIYAYLAAVASNTFYDEECRHFLGLAKTGWEILSLVAIGRSSAPGATQYAPPM